MSQQQSSKSKEISTLLAVIFGGGACALLVAIFLVYFYGPSGLYDAKHSLLSPGMLTELRYQDVNPQTGSRSFYVFEGIEFTFFDSEVGRWKKERVSIDKYRKFFDTIAGDVSVRQDPEAVSDHFLAGNPAMLKIIVQGENGTAGSSKTFQEVTFAYQGDYYRIELHEQSNQENWAYFFHKGIYQTAIAILK